MTAIRLNRTELDLIKYAMSPYGRKDFDTPQTAPHRGFVTRVRHHHSPLSDREFAAVDSLIAKGLCRFIDTEENSWWCSAGRRQVTVDRVNFELTFSVDNPPPMFYKGTKKQETIG